MFHSIFNIWIFKMKFIISSRQGCVPDSTGSRCVSPQDRQSPIPVQNSGQQLSPASARRVGLRRQTATFIEDQVTCKPGSNFPPNLASQHHDRETLATYPIFSVRREKRISAFPVTRRQCRTGFWIWRGTCRNHKFQQRRQIWKKGFT